MSEISPRPWRIAVFEDEPDERYIVDANGKKFKHTNKVVMHVIKCVNEHDSLVAEVERLKQVRVEALKHKEKECEDIDNANNAIIVKLKQENEQLRDMLRKCSPYKYTFYAGSDYDTNCEFCSNDDYSGHTDDCEYLKLTETK